MKFPSYVPNAICEWIANALDGDPERGTTGWRATLGASESELDRVRGLSSSTKDPEGLVNVSAKHERAKANAIGFENVACLERLGSRSEMKEAYERLVGELGTDAALRSFISAAWVADMDYDPIRIRIKTAAKLAGKVAAAARTLHDLLREAEGFGMYLPSEFFSLRSLLRNTNHELGHRNHSMWPGLRLSILGDSRDPPTTDVNVEWDRLEAVFVSAMDATPIQPEEEFRNGLNYAWGTAPNMRHVVATLQRTAEMCEPAETGYIDAALSRQKRLRKTEYLRAFALLLRNEHHIKLTANIMNAMAVTAAVVLDDIDVPYDDVRKAVASLPNSAAEDS